MAQICHAAEQGKTVVLSQTEDIHGSFYDLFNQNFRRIYDPKKKETRCYANVAIGSYNKPSRVNENFQCVVIIKKSEVENTPKAFLNRFEKFPLSHRDFLKASMSKLSPPLQSAVELAFQKVA